MTSVDDPLADAPTAPVPVVAEEPRPPLKDRLRVIRRRAGGITLVTLIVVILAAVVVEGPLSSVWYSFRQEHLSSQFGNPGAPRTGSPLAIIQMPTRGINLTVVEGDGSGTLRAGPGHRPSSPVPGATGNSVIFGHRYNWGGPFSKLFKVKKGDSLFLERRSRSGDQVPLFYTVVSVKTVPSGDRAPYAPSIDHRVTLVTSAGSGKRLIVQAVSGVVHKQGRPTVATGTGLGGSGSAVGMSLIWFGICVVAGAGAVLLVRLRHRGVVVVVAVVPFAAGALLSIILAGDALFRAPLS